MAFDFMQTLTPPKSKSPWSAATSGGSNKNAALEKWGPLINSIGKIIGNAIYPGAGSVGSTIGGAIGMEGEGTGFQGTDKGWSNVGSTVQGAWAGYKSNPWSGALKTYSNYTSNGSNDSISQGLGNYESGNKMDISSILSLAARNYAGSQKGAFTEEHFNNLTQEEFLPYLLEATKTYHLGGNSSFFKVHTIGGSNGR